MAFTIKPTTCPVISVTYAVDWRGCKAADSGCKYIRNRKKALEFVLEKKAAGYRVSIQSLTSSNHVQDLVLKELVDN